MVKTVFAALTAPLLVFASSGCTHLYEYKIEAGTDYSAANKVNMAVELRLSKSLREAEWRTSGGGDEWIIPLGENLCENAKTLAHALFTDVLVTEGTPTSPQRSGIRATLVPRMLTAIRTHPASAFGEQITSVILEWSLRDLNGNLIWIDTVTAHGRNSVGKVEEQVQELFDDLFAPSYDSLSSSKEIRDFAAR